MTGSFGKLKGILIFSVHYFFAEGKKVKVKTQKLCYQFEFIKCMWFGLSLINQKSAWNSIIANILILCILAVTFRDQKNKLILQENMIQIYDGVFNTAKICLFVSINNHVLSISLFLSTIKHWKSLAYKWLYSTLMYLIVLQNFL